MNLSMLLHQAGTTDSLFVLDTDRWQIFSKALPRPAQAFQGGFLGAERFRPDIFRYVNDLRFRYTQKGVFTNVREFGV